MFSRPTPARLKAVANLQQGGAGSRRPGPTTAVRGPGRRSAPRPWLGASSPPGWSVGSTGSRHAPAARRLGRWSGWSPPSSCWGSVAAVLGVLYTVSTGRTGAGVLAAAVTVIAFFVPELLLYSRGQKRSETIALELADTLDQMTIAVEAGLGFESAMAQAGRNGNGPLAEELVRTLQDIEMGRSRRQAYESLASRTDVDDLGRFTRAVIQADAHGISIADVLRTQAAEMRIKRRQRAEEKAMQIPVKVVFPLLLCILPVLFIVLLAPAAMDVARAFS